MSKDLISRSKLMSYIEKQYRQWGEDYDAKQILGDIEDMPTAYDEDKVVGQMEEYIRESSNADYNRAMIEAIAIVKRH